MTETYTIGLGISDYLKLRTYPRNYFVDKSLFIRKVLTDQSEVQLFPRPRRFGKTLNMRKPFIFFVTSRVRASRTTHIWPRGC